MDRCVSLVPPTEIVFLRTTVPAYGAYQFGTFDVMFEIQGGNADQAFDVVKRIENGVYVGETARLVSTCVLSNEGYSVQQRVTASFQLSGQGYFRNTTLALHNKLIHNANSNAKAEPARMHSSCHPRNPHTRAHRHTHTHTHTHLHTQTEDSNSPHTNTNGRQTKNEKNLREDKAR